MGAETGTSLTAVPAHHEGRWGGLAIILISTLIIALDGTMVNIALPRIGEALDNPGGIQWLITANLLANAVSMTASAWLADRIGPKRFFLIVMALFSVASLGAAFAPNLGFLIAARAAQGACSGVLNPLSMTIMLDLFPVNERGKAMGIWGLVAMTAPAIGPTLGGFLVTAVSWHWLFIPNIPIGILGALAGRKLLADVPARHAGRFDAVGWFLGGIGLSSFLFGLSQTRRWGWASTGTIVSLTLGVVLLIAFVVTSLRKREPLLDLRLVKNQLYRRSLVLISLVTLPQYARSVFMPLQLQKLRGDSALRVGVILTPAAVATALSMAVGGRMVDRLGARRPALAGCTLMLAGALANAFLTTSTSEIFIAAVMTVQGFGVGLIMIPLTVTAMNSVPEGRVGQASTMRALANQVAAALSVATVFAVVNARLSGAGTLGAQQAAYNAAMQLGVVAMIIAIAFAWRLPD